MNKILVKGNNWLGDCVMSIPTINSLKKIFKNSTITILSKPGLSSLYKLVPRVDSVIEHTNFLPTIFKLRKQEYDIVLILPRSLGSAMLGAAPKSKMRIGYKTDGRGLLLTHRLKRSSDILKKHRVYYYHHLLSVFGEVPSVEPPRLELNDTLEKGAVDTVGKSNFIGLNPGATYGEAKMWYTDRYIELSKRLLKEFDMEILVFGAGQDQVIANKIEKAVGHGIRNFTGKTNIEQLSALISRCKLFVTNDTGPMHIADALGIPVVAIFGPTDPVTTRPFSDNHILIRKELECSPCLERVCPLKHHNCMKMIEVNEVFDACKRILK